MKQIKFDTTIIGTSSLTRAEQEAGAAVGDKVRIVRAMDNDGFSAPVYFILPDGQKCPCCAGVLKIEFTSKRP